ncbi:META domain-containing protein [Kaistella jeonii]|uniref:Heat shock protein HslJ n=1 Tax=Kaistella jeonii TaxID=266749 RepID=A0A0C1FRZ1_9FLAO|nr:META domain-containing protein [Kaistella jeonii]KIA90669.1 heat shock protein HslJ [Kaistella jeonii]SFB69322.1 Heat shock protein HslJ [Kaistella jeonii]VEI94726.1 META domain [Kaistella jeonii]
MKNIFLALFAVATFASCSTMSSSKVGGAQANISNTHWTLADNVKGKKPTLNIEAGKITGNAGCNNYFGELSLDPTAGNFMTKNVGATKMACDNLQVENQFLSMLNEANKYVVSGNTLELYKGNLLLMKLNKL